MNGAGVECLLLGTKYTPLRDEFRAAASALKKDLGPHTDKRKRILVTMGAADPDNVTRLVLQALDMIGAAGSYHVRVVLGPAYDHGDPADSLGLEYVETKRAVCDMAGEFRWADVVISGAGSTSWELCFLGKAMLSLVLAENQRPIAECLAQRGAARVSMPESMYKDGLADFFTESLSNWPRLEATAKNAAKLIDGRGPERVVEKMLEISKKMR